MPGPPSAGTCIGVCVGLYTKYEAAWPTSSWIQLTHRKTVDANLVSDWRVSSPSESHAASSASVWLTAGMYTCKSAHQRSMIGSVRRVVSSG